MSESSLDQLYAAHLQTLMRRTERSLAASGFDALVIHAGARRSSSWTIRTTRSRSIRISRPGCRSWTIRAAFWCIAPGARPKVLFHQPNDYWHKPARLPQAPWTAAVDLIAMDEPSKAGAHWAKLGRVAFIGPDGLRPGRRSGKHQSAGACWRGCTTIAPSRPPTSSTACAERANWARADIAAALAAFRRGGSEYEAHMRYLEACAQREEEMPYNNIVAYNENAAVLHYQHLERARPGAAALLSDRRRRPIPRLCVGYHAHLCARRRAALPIWCEAMDAAQLALCGEIVAGPRLSRCAPVGASRPGRCHAADRTDQTTRAGGLGSGRHQRVLSARHRPSARTAGARRRRRDGRRAGPRARAARRPSLPAPHAHARARAWW